MPSTKPYWITKTPVEQFYCHSFASTLRTMLWLRAGQLDMMITWECYSGYANSLPVFWVKPIGRVVLWQRNIWKRMVNHGYYVHIWPHKSWLYNAFPEKQVGSHIEFVVNIWCRKGSLSNLVKWGWVGAQFLLFFMAIVSVCSQGRADVQEM